LKSTESQLRRIIREEIQKESRDNPVVLPRRTNGSFSSAWSRNIQSGKYYVLSTVGDHYTVSLGPYSGMSRLINDLYNSYTREEIRHSKLFALASETGMNVVDMKGNDKGKFIDRREIYLP
jgi:hypothetical protein